jgi:HK97 family phage prohead protease
MEYKQIPLEVKQFGDDADDASFHIFEGLASTFGNVDFGDDVVVKGAFKDTLKERTPIILWQHGMTEPIGMPMDLKENNEGLFVKARMPKEDSLVSGRVAPQMRVGSVKPMSIGFSVDDFEIKDGIRFIKKAKLWEISLVTIPMNPKAKVTNFKTATPFKDLPLADRDRPWNAPAAIGRVKALTGSTDEPSDTYKNAFLYYDRANKEDFGAYKLPFADVIDGKLTAVPRGIFAAAAAMQGARGGVDIPDSDKAGVERHINRYYDKIGLESPFEKSGIGMIELESMDAKGIEEYLRGQEILSKSACTSMAARFVLGRSDSGKSKQSDSGTALLSEMKKLTQKLKEKE